jgi:hypothetical protein
VPDTTLRYVSASDSVGQLLLRGEGSAGFMSLANYQSLSPAARDGLRVLAESLPMAGRVYALNARHAARREAISAALWAFADTPKPSSIARYSWVATAPRAPRTGGAGFTPTSAWPQTRQVVHFAPWRRSAAGWLHCWSNGDAGHPGGQQLRLLREAMATRPASRPSRSPGAVAALVALLGSPTTPRCRRC